MKRANILDRDLNLHSSYLLEASAGTGKTFSIENIVTRLLIEGDQPLTIEQILVVTFTKASASDLQARIRQNIEKSIKALKSSFSTFDYIVNILEKQEEVIDLAIFRLKAALFTFDQAQIFTIHAFCAKMLRNHFLEGNAPCGNANEESRLLNTEILKIIRNFFRTGLTPSKYSPNQLNLVLKRHKFHIESLEKALSKVIEKNVEFVDVKDFNDAFEEFKKFFKCHPFEKDKIIADFNLQIPNYRKLKEYSFENILFFASLFEKEEVTITDFDRFILEGIQFFDCLHESLLKVRSKPVLESELFYPRLHKLIEIELLPIVEVSRSYEMIFSKMAHDCKEYLKHYLQEEEKFSFDDLLKMMQNALKNKAFLKAVRDMYKAGIIDEFQDTDPVQWKIFKEIFYQHAPFYLVGDPKQSIYAFRQADIYTYLKAANLIEPDHRLSLDVNFRSHKPLVHALNALFNDKTVKNFIELPKLQSVLEYRPVEAAKQEVYFEDDLGSIHFFIVEENNAKKMKIEAMEEFYFPFIAKEIINLRKQGIKLSEIAILVKDNRQAKRVASYLKTKRIETFLQKNSSLSDSYLLQSLTELILAVISPKDESALKTALGNPLIGFTEEDILSLQDPFKLEAILNEFFALRKLLYIKGFASFFEAFLKSVWKESGVAARLLKLEDGVILYQDLMQIAEILIEYQSKYQASPEKLVRFLQEFEELDFDLDERLKRVKNISDDAVQVLTIHSSKGLEFEIVFALGVVNKTPSADLFVPVQTEEKTTLLPICDKRSEVYQQHLKELDAEKSRQLYVALTRAKYRVYIPVACVREAKEKEDGSASCMELFLKKFHVLNPSLTDFIDQVSKEVHITYSKLDDQVQSFEDVLQKPHYELHEPALFSVNIKPISMVSFTQLAEKGAFKSIQGVPHNFEAAEKNPHQLPSSQETGILLHLILESFPFEKYRELKDASELYPFVAPFVLGTKFEDWKEVIADILFNVLNCRLDFFNFKDIDPLKTYREQEFIYPHSQGFIKGVIDFMFCYEGKYYFIDWKSNWLGNSCADYGQDSLKRAMIEQDYLLQAKIYKEAFQRFLKIIEKNEFEDCFGGIFYIFLRGLSLQKPDLGVLHFKETKGEL